MNELQNYSGIVKNDPDLSGTDKTRSELLLRLLSRKLSMTDVVLRAISAHVCQLLLNARNRTLNCGRNIYVEEWPVLSMKCGDLPREALVSTDCLNLILSLYISNLGAGCVQRCVAVYWVPVLAGGKALTVNVAKAGSGQSTLSPAAVD